MGRRSGAIVLAVLVGLTGCGGSSGGAPGGDGSAGVGIDLAYQGTATSRAEGYARTLAASTPLSDPAPRPPSDTWLRITVSGPDFAPITCQFPRRIGGECGGIPAGSGRTVTVEEWDSGFGTLFFRGQAGGVVVHARRSTRVRVPMHPPVLVQYPAADSAVNLTTFSAVVQSEPHAKVILYLGTYLVGTGTADGSGAAEIQVADGGPSVPARTDGRPGLPDADYLFTAVALPPVAAGGALVRHQGPAQTFAVDLVPPALALSAPSLTSDTAVDLSGVTEAGARVRCGDAAPSEAVEVDPGGRFVRWALPLSAAATRFVCEATDRAGNATTRDFVVAYLPEGFSLQASLPDVTRSLTETLRVTTDPSVEDLKIDVLGELSQATRETIVPRQGDAGIFEVPVALFENQWNRVSMAARVGGVPLGAAEVAVEHDSVPPMPPQLLTTLVPNWIEDPAMGYFDGQKLHLAYYTAVLSQPDAGGRIEVFVSQLPFNTIGIASDGGHVLDPEPTSLLGLSEDGIFRVPMGTCFSGLMGRTVDRAGNVSTGWGIVGFGLLLLENCVL